MFPNYVSKFTFIKESFNWLDHKLSEGSEKWYVNEFCSRNMTESCMLSPKKEFRENIRRRDTTYYYKILNLIFN